MPNQSGPVTSTGKSISCMNHLTHGAASSSLFIQGEDPAEFDALLKDGFETHQPATPDDARLIGDFALARWLLVRRQRIHAEYEYTLHGAKPDPTVWTGEDLHKLNLMDRYKAQAERAFKRSLDNVLAIRKLASAEQRWQDLYELQKQRFQLQRERFELAKEKEARVVAKQDAQRAKRERQNVAHPHQQNSPQPKEQHQPPPYPTASAAAA